MLSSQHWKEAIVFLLSVGVQTTWEVNKGQALLSVWAEVKFQWDFSKTLIAVRNVRPGHH